MLRVLTNVLCASALTSLRQDTYLNVNEHEDPKGPGAGESSQDLACQECANHQEHIVTATRDECFCHATDINGTFQSDATKSATLRSTETSTDAEGNVTHKSVVRKENEGLERLPENWHWHCRKVTDDEGTWKKCPQKKVPHV